MRKFNIVSFFAGCGGLDFGFHKAGFKISWANEYDSSIWDTYRLNHPNTELDTRSIADVLSDDVPDCDGIIGGPPCQSWSEAGAQRGIDDPRGQLFFEYIRILRDKQPMFFLAENVSGMMAKKHSEARSNIIRLFDEAGYNVVWKMVNARDYSVPQDRKRLIFVGYRKDLGFVYKFPTPHERKLTLRDAIWDLQGKEVNALEKNRANPNCRIPNHEYMVGGFSTIFMSRNRVRAWDEPSFTIQAGGRHAPIHPQANKMIKLGRDKFIFDPDSPNEYRRLTVREAARIQTFPDKFIYDYQRVADGYKMVGNAVPVNLALALGKAIYQDMTDYLNGRTIGGIK